MSANVKDTKRGRIPGTLDGMLPGESLDEFEKRVGDDIPELTDEDMARARPLSDFPELAAALENARVAMRGQRGPQKAPVKDRVGLRLDHAVVEYFRATGPGWQSRINEILANYVKNASK
ncbi:MAG TPA: BrnA antitoxin family protein [Devosia sp.]|nr:BrnA antitoxin family protein [Devosia sp.]